jgi:hypothetical protein
MRKAFLIALSFFVILSLHFAVFMEEELSATQFGFSGKVHTVQIEIAKLGAELLISDPETLTFNEKGFLISRETEEVKIEYFYDDFGRLKRKDFMNKDKTVFQRVEVLYEDDYYDAVAFDDSGMELERTRYWIDSEERTLIFSVKTETGVSTNTIFFDENGRKTESYSLIRENVSELDMQVTIVVESTFTYDSNGYLEGEKTVVRIRKEGREQASEYRSRIDILLTDEQGNPVRELRRTEFLDNSSAPEEFIYSREYTYF